MSSLKNTVFALLLLGLTSCGPRGESASLDQVVSKAQTDFQETLQELKPGMLPSDLESKIETLAADLGKYSDKTEVADWRGQSAEMAQQLNELLAHAGYPSRAALSSLIQELRSQSTVTGEGNPSARRLLGARALTLLAAELRGAAFGA